MFQELRNYPLLQKKVRQRGGGSQIDFRHERSSQVRNIKLIQSKKAGLIQAMFLPVKLKQDVRGMSVPITDFFSEEPQVFRESDLTSLRKVPL